MSVISEQEFLTLYDVLLKNTDVENLSHPDFLYLEMLLEVLFYGESKPIYDSSTKELMSDKSLISMFGKQLRFDLTKGFPLYTTKKVFYRGAFEEMLWFIQDKGNLTSLIQKNVHIWDEWGWKYYQQNLSGMLPVNSQQELVEYLKTTGQPLYLPLHYTNFTHWKYFDPSYDEANNTLVVTKYLDQMQWVVENLPKRPERKSYYVTCWDPTEAYQMADECDKESVIIVACHIDHILNVSNGRLNMRVGIRSNDLFLGNPFNVAQYAMLLHMYSFLTKYPVGELIVNLDDHHIYYNHIGQCVEQITRPLKPLPNLTIKDRGQTSMQDFVFEDFILTGYDPHPTLQGDITVVGGY